MYSVFTFTPQMHHYLVVLRDMYKKTHIAISQLSSAGTICQSPFQSLIFVLPVLPTRLATLYGFATDRLDTCDSSVTHYTPLKCVRRPGLEAPGRGWAPLRSERKSLLRLTAISATSDSCWFSFLLSRFPQMTSVKNKSHISTNEDMLEVNNIYIHYKWSSLRITYLLFPILFNILVSC